MAVYMTDSNANLIPVAGSSLNSSIIAEIEALKSQISNLQNELKEAPLKAHPINSLYISYIKNNPKDILGGGEWELLDEGYALWTTTSDNTGGSKISAGLPNITGQIGNALSDQAIDKASGAFTTWASAVGFEGSNQYKWTSFDFDANRGASVKGIYGNSKTVQPPSIRVYVWRRYA